MRCSAPAGAADRPSPVKGEVGGCHGAQIFPTPLPGRTRLWCGLRWGGATVISSVPSGRFAERLPSPPHLAHPPGYFLRIGAGIEGANAEIPLSRRAETAPRRDDHVQLMQQAIEHLPGTRS